MADSAPPDRTGGIFVNYRNGPNTVTVSALTAWLRRHFGDDQVFRDIQMRPGTRYPDELRERLRTCGVLIAVIHEGWLTELEEREEDDLDWVRHEITTAVALDKPIVPVLLGKVAAPTENQLRPHGLVELASRQVARVGDEDFDSDVSQLARLLERYVAPDHPPTPRPTPAEKTPRVGLRVLAWAAGLFASTLILFNDGGPLWRVFALPAFVSTVVLATMSLLFILITPLGKRLNHRWQRTTAPLSLRETWRRSWIVPVLAALPLVYFLTEFGTRQDGEWQKWEVWYVVLVVVVTAAFAHRAWRRQDSQDQKWPPPVSTEPATFHRAIHRLHERLTTDPRWRSNRPLAGQREAVAVYLDLAEVCLRLRKRAAATPSEWIRQGYVRETAGFLGWALSIVAIDLVALTALTTTEAATPGAYLVIAMIAAVALALTAAKIAVDLRADRKEVNRWIDELTEWQAVLGPLIFCADHRSAHSVVHRGAQAWDSRHHR
jgi:TIR domain